MHCVRIIPRLEIKGPHLVKGVHLEGLRVLGDPWKFAKQYAEDGVDEILYVDVVASLYERNSLTDLIAKTAKEIFIPLTVGGGIRSIEDIRTVFRAGADKVSINTAAIKRPEFIKEAARVFGSSNIVVALEVIKQADGNYLCFTDNGREYTGLKAIDWALHAESLGAGEIIVTAIDREGTGDGFDLELLTQITQVTKIPVVAHGGGGKQKHFREVLKIGGIEATASSSMLHYSLLNRKTWSVSDRTIGNTDFLTSETAYMSHKFEPASIITLKQYLQKSGVQVRL